MIKSFIYLKVSVENLTNQAYSRIVLYRFGLANAVSTILQYFKVLKRQLWTSYKAR